MPKKIPQYEGIFSSLPVPDAPYSLTEDGTLYSYGQPVDISSRFYFLDLPTNRLIKVRPKRQMLDPLPATPVLQGVKLQTVLNQQPTEHLLTGEHGHVRLSAAKDGITMETHAQTLGLLTTSHPQNVAISVMQESVHTEAVKTHLKLEDSLEYQIHIAALKQKSNLQPQIEIGLDDLKTIFQSEQNQALQTEYTIKTFEALSTRLCITLHEGKSFGAQIHLPAKSQLEVKIINQKNLQVSLKIQTDPKQKATVVLCSGKEQYHLQSLAGNLNLVSIL